MRMDQNQTLSAYEVVNDYPYEALVRIFFRYGEDKFSKQIARKIEQARKIKPIETTIELADLIKSALPQKELKKKGHVVTFLLGARTAADLLRMEAFQAYGEVYVTTEDASMGEKGFVTQHSLLQHQNFDFIYTCGPTPMMQAVARYAKEKGIPCEASLENTMACGLGACLCCVTDTQHGHKCVCSDGPVFNINELKW